MGGWMGVKAILRIAYTNKNVSLSELSLFNLFFLQNYSSNRLK